MNKRIAAGFLTLLLNWPALAAESSSVITQSDVIWEAIKVFEGDATTVSGDFDCQGMSVGIAQWNIGKSLASVRSIVTAIPPDQLAAAMPKFRQPFIKALNGDKDGALAFVRGLQTIEHPESCDANTRNARWSPEGKSFVKELSSALGLPASIQAQRNLRSDIFASGLQNAKIWATAARGEGALPSNEEVAYFVDMQNFNGGGLTKFGLAVKPLTPDVRKLCAAQVIEYLRTADDAFLLHKKAARRNASLLTLESLNDSPLDLFCLSHQVALKLSATHARQFRLTVINRRAAILFGQAFYSDRDSTPTKIRFASSR
ncbi:MAG: hypothetical protein QM776_07000 [Rhodocyclaceae bacterium]